MAVNDYALVVGINNYPRLGAGLTLEGPAHDAAAFVQWLTTKQDPVPGDNIKAFLSPDDPQLCEKSPNYYEVEHWLDDLNERGLQGTDFGRLYLFLAGHGFEVSPPPNYVALLMADGDYVRFNKYHFPGFFHADSLRKTGSFQEVILFMDTCRDDLQFRCAQRDIYYQRRGETQARLFYGLATKWGGKSRETPVTLNGRNVVCGRFSRVVIEGLRGGAGQGNEPITGAMLATFVKQRFAMIRNDSPADLRSAIKDPEFGLDDGMSIVLAGPPQAPAQGVAGVVVRITLKVRLEGNPRYLHLISPSQEFLNQYSADPNDGLILLRGMNPGLYSLVVPETNWVKYFKVVGSQVIVVPDDQVDPTLRVLPIDVQLDPG